MSLIDDLNEAAKKPGSSCKMCVILDALSPADAEAVREALATGRLSRSATARVLTKNGHPIGETAIGKHVNREHA